MSIQTISRINTTARTETAVFANSPVLSGAVVIGRNEGERLRRCLASLLPNFQHIVYVDSGSTDGSIEFAESLRVAVVRLDPNLPFTAARARNAGLERLTQILPDAVYVQFIDGDCELDSSWPAVGISHLDRDQNLAVVCGRRRERALDTSLYNRLIDLEWNTPIGDAKWCGGDSFVRVAAFLQVGGFAASLVAGEEPEFCFRLARKGWTIKRLDAPMTCHDAAICSFRQWWRREIRTGYGAYEVWRRCGANRQAPFDHLIRSAFTWSLAWPCVTAFSTVLAALVAGPLVALAVVSGMLGLFVIQMLRIAVDGRRKNLAWREAFAYGALAVASKFAQLRGCVLRQWRFSRDTTSIGIEYKQPGADNNMQPRLRSVDSPAQREKASARV